MMQKGLRRRIVNLSLVGAVLAGAGYFVWQEFRPDGLRGIASSNGRIEATEIDVATKLAGRVLEIDVEEGDFVSPGQIVARMDVESLRAQLSRAQAEARRAETALQTARVQVAQRESEKNTAEAVVDQRQAELTAAIKRYGRTETLVERNVLPRQQLDDDLAAQQGARAALAAAKSQVLSAQAAIESAQSQVVETESGLDAARAAVAQIQADINDSQLKSDRVARVQYRVAQPGEVLAAGGTVLNLVDLTDVYMTFFLPTDEAGRVALGSEVHLVLDAAPAYVIPAEVTYVASVAQFTPKTVETESEREKLMFRVKARIDPALLKEHLEQVKTGLPGVAYVKLDPEVEWPPEIQVNVFP